MVLPASRISSPDSVARPAGVSTVLPVGLLGAPASASFAVDEAAAAGVELGAALAAPSASAAGAGGLSHAAPSVSDMTETRTRARPPRADREVRMPTTLTHRSEQTAHVSSILGSRPRAVPNRSRAAARADPARRGSGAGAARRAKRAGTEGGLRACRLDETQRKNDLADCRTTAALPHGPGLPRQVP